MALSYESTTNGASPATMEILAKAAMPTGPTRTPTIPPLIKASGSCAPVSQITTSATSSNSPV